MRTSLQEADLESLISELLTALIDWPVADLDQKVDDVLRRICESFGLDIAVLWQWSRETPEIIRATHHYLADPGQQPPTSLDETQFPWYRQQMLAGRTVAIASLDELPPEAATDRRHGELLGIRSSLCIPLVLEQERPLGALALNVGRAETAWPAAVIRQLHLVAKVMAAALARRRASQALRDSESQLQFVIDAAGTGLWTLDLQSGTFWITDRTREMFGLPQGGKITLQHLASSIDPDDWPTVRAAIERCGSAGDNLDLECRVVSDGPTARWVALLGRRVASAGAQHRLAGICTDVSEPRRLAAAMRSYQARLLAGAQLAGLGFYEADHRTDRLQCDDRFLELFGLDSPHGSYIHAMRWWAERVDPEDRPRVMGLRERLHRGELDVITDEYRYHHPVRGVIWIRHLAASGRRAADGRMLANVGVVRDVGHQKRIEGDLRHMSQRLLHAQEQERKLIARELHDDLSQRLAALAIAVGRAERAGAGGDPAQVLAPIREELVRVSEDVHALAYQLHPSVLEELGLAEALRAECEHRARQGGPDIAWSIDAVQDDTSKETALCLFRVAQEALGNALRHARAHRVDLRLSARDGGLALAVHDDGIGFDMEQQEGRGSLGLVSMHERMRIVGGMLDIDSAPGSGTTVIAWAPARAVAP
jgi:signal transduction histidine kinase